ncbi:MAG: M23 family metallopeptidase [bacterium]|nr:M23 family metallopeptidase [bacterium]
MLDLILNEVQEWVVAVLGYLKAKIHVLALLVEAGKRLVVTQLLWRRGMLERPFLHVSMGLLAFMVLFVGGAVRSSSVVGSVYPGISDERVLGSSTEESFRLPADITATTNISEKPRDKIEPYIVQEGDTLFSVAEKFGIDVNTLRWANDLRNDFVIVGDALDILPVSGIAHTVLRGDTIYGIAKKYDVSAQAILDFPFNDVGDDLALQIGTVLIVPGGVPPESRVTPRERLFVSRGSTVADGSAQQGTGSFRWPTSGEITQYFAWYHPGIDIADKETPGIAAADGGRVTVAGWIDATGYGNRVEIDHGNGFRSRYAHLSRVYVSVGDFVQAGDIIGQMGSTGRSTGTHLHFEISQNGAAINPLSMLK